MITYAKNTQLNKTDASVIVEFGCSLVWLSSILTLHFMFEAMDGCAYFVIKEL